MVFKPRVAGLLALSIVCLLVSTGSQAGRDNEPILSGYHIAPKDDATMRKVARLFEVERRDGNTFDIIVPAARANELFALVPDARLTQADIHADLKRMTAEEFRGYHNYQSAQDELKQIAADHPDMAKYEVYGQSQEGRDLFALTLTGTKVGGATKAEVMLTSSTHGNELITVEVLLGLLNQLVDGYKKDSRLTAILDTHVLYFIPVVNPDGYVRQSRYANGLDPNRDYPYPDDPNQQSNACIKGVMDFFNSHNIKASLDYHSAGGMYMYPWSYTSQQVPAEDYQKFDQVSAKMAATNGYQYGQIPAILYIAQGASADYYYWKNHTFAMAVEIAGTNVPASSQIQHYVDQNADALWIFIESTQ
jgi:hypothetical protein